MTTPAPETLERERDRLYLSDAALIRWLGVPDKAFRAILPALETKYNFPRKQPFFGNKRYKPAVKAWLDKHNGLMMDPSTTRRETR